MWAVDSDRLIILQLQACVGELAALQQELHTNHELQAVAIALWRAADTCLWGEGIV